MGGFGFGELVVIAVIVIVLFGVKRIPELGSSLGQGIANFRKSFKESQAIDVTPTENKSGHITDESHNENITTSSKKEKEKSEV